MSLTMVGFLDSNLTLYALNHFVKTKIYLYFLSFLNARMAETIQIYLQGRRGPMYPTPLVPWLLMTWGQKDSVRTTHRITIKHSSFLALLMVITWWDFGEVLLETFILANFLWKFLMCFFKVKHYFGHISGMVCPIDVKWKGSASVGYWVQYVTLTFDLTHDLALGCFKVKLRNSSISGIVGLIDVKWKQSELIWYWADCMTLPFDHTHDLDLGVEISRSESEIALSQEWDGWLTWNEKDVSHSFMTMILTSVSDHGGVGRCTR